MDNSWNNMRGSKINKDTLDLDKIEKNIIHIVCKEFENIKFKDIDNKYGKIIYK